MPSVKPALVQVAATAGSMTSVWPVAGVISCALRKSIAALQSEKDDYFRVKVAGCAFSFSGVQNQYQARIKAGEGREDVCRFVLKTVAHTILKATKNARKNQDLPVLISGGVSVCSLVQDVFAKEKDLWFAQKGLGGDNAVGTAILASMR